MTAEEQRELLAREAEPCVSYRRRVAKAVPVALVLLAVTAGVQAGEVDNLADAEDDVEVLQSVTISGGISARTEDLFLSSALPEPVDGGILTGSQDSAESQL
ncbi:MAG: hypothetical protein KDI56_16340 [Xanthomonadales bacterium]|nr:hypothetical protein [Xanthomonadales bacterium]